MQEFHNHITLIGNIGSDVQLTKLSTGAALARASIATNEYHRKPDGKRIKQTRWYNLVAWGGSAEKMAELLEKGSHVIVYGHLISRSYEDRYGTVRYLSEIVVKHFDSPKRKAS